MKIKRSKSTELFISEEMWTVTILAIILIIILILDNIRLRYIRKIKDRIIDNQCIDINNALNGRKDLVFKRMNENVNPDALSCGACRYMKRDRKENPCKSCIKYSNFEYSISKFNKGKKSK